MEAFSDASGILCVDRLESTEAQAFQCPLIPGLRGQSVTPLAFSPDGNWLLAHTSAQALVALPINTSTASICAAATPAELVLPSAIIKLNAESSTWVSSTGDRTAIFVEVEGSPPPQNSAFYRVELRAGDVTTPLVLDTSMPMSAVAPVEGGRLAGGPTAFGKRTRAAAWLIDSTAAKGPAVCAVLLHEDGIYSLLVRSRVECRLGGSKWAATCQRLRLPLPPVDTQAPLLFGEWVHAAQWGEDDEKIELLGLKDGLVWLNDTKNAHLLTVDKDGSMAELPLH